MEDLVGQHDTVLAIKEEFPVFGITKVENVEQEQQHCSYTETIESNLYIKLEEIDIKLEELDYESVNAIKKEYLGTEIERGFNVVHDLKQEGIDIDENKFDLKNEAGDFNTEQTALASIPVAQLSSNSESGRTSVRQTTLGDVTSTLEIYPHDSKRTPRQGKRKSTKKKNSRTRFLLKCEQCFYVSKSPSRYQAHMRVHKDPSELDMHECTQCDFKTKHKNSLKEHSILHKDAADLPKYKCYSCDFESKRKGALTKHIIRGHQRSKLINQVKQKPENKTNSEKVLLTCEQCSYVCKHPSRLDLHLRVHKDPSELDMYKCTQCDFVTKHRSSLKGHSIMHKDTAGIPMYKCNSCNFESKRKSGVRKHIAAVHQKGSGLYRCTHCSYVDQFKYRLQAHMLSHRQPLETP